MFDDDVTCVLLTRWPERSAMLDDALRGYAHQTHPDRKLVIANDGAPLRATAPGVTVLNLTRRSVGAKRNAAIAAVDGFACWLDDDDAWMPEHTASLLRAATDAGVPWARSSHAWLADERLRVVGRIAGPLASTIVAADAVRRVGGFPEIDYAEDSALWRALRAAMGEPPLAAAATYVVRRHTGNVSRGKSFGVMDERARRGAVARGWWRDPDFDDATARIAALRAAPVPGPWPLVAPVDGRQPAPQARPRVLAAPMPFVVDGIVDATHASAPCVEAVVKAARDAACLRRIAVVKLGHDRADALRLAVLGLSGTAPGAVAWIDARACGLRRDHVCNLTEAVRAGGAALARGTADVGEVGNKIAPWAPWGWPAAMVVRWSALRAIPGHLWTDDALPAALAEGVRRAGGTLETMTLDGVSLPREATPIAERIARAVDAVRAMRSR